MVPSKIKALVDHLIDGTEHHDKKWEYQDDEAQVILYDEKIDVAISYKFDVHKEVGTFNVRLHQKSNSKDYYFSTDQDESDYSRVSHLYDVAQSSDLDLDLDLDLD